MINIEKAIDEFKKYSNNYDMQNSHIKRKYAHSLRVMQESNYIAKNLNLTQEQIDLAELIGLLHDIARYEQMKRYSTFNDAISVDHGDLGVEILKDNNYIRRFIEEDKYDNIILKAIKNHNKYKIQEGLTEEVVLQSKIIRDADKLDIFYEGVEMFWNEPNEVLEVEKSVISENCYKEFINNHTIKRIKESTPADRLITFVAFIFDINFQVSIIRICEEDYINKIIDKFDFKNQDTADKIKEIRRIANEYIQKRKG